MPDVKFMLKETNEAQDAKIIGPITSLGLIVTDIDCISTKHERLLGHQ